MALTITHYKPNNYYYGVWVGATYNSYNYMKVTNSDTSNDVVLKSFTIYGAACTLFFNTPLPGVAGTGFQGSSQKFSITAKCNGKTSNTVTVNTYAGYVRSNLSGYALTFTFSDPPTIPKNSSKDINLTFTNTAGLYPIPNTDWQTGSLFTYNDTGTPAPTSTYENATKSITLTLGAGVSSATATGGTTGSKTWTSGSQTFAGVAYNGSVKLTAFKLATGYHAGTNTVVNKTFTSNTTISGAANTYTVNYYNGSTKVDSSSHTYDTSKALNTASSMSMTKTNWSFYGWTTSTSAVTRSYTDGQSVKNLTSTNGGSVTLYAIWSRTVSFWSGIKYATTKTATCYYNSKGENYSVTVPSGTATISTWTFLGWRNDNTAGAKEANSTGTITLAPYGPAEALSNCGYYGVYSRTLTLSYTNGGGTGTAPSNSTATQYYNGGGNTITTPSFTLANNTFTRTGYTFNKWDVGNAGASYSWGPAVSTTTVTKSTAATWTGVPYTVKFNANGGSGTMSNLSCVYGTAKALTANGFTAPTNGGYAFAGWATSESNAQSGTVAYADKANITTGTSTSGGTVNLYAVWKRTLTFNSGINNAKKPTAVQYYGGNVTFPALTAIDGWTALGYRNDTTAGGKEYSTGAQAYTSTATLYSVYSRTVTLTYDGNGSTSGTKPSNTTGVQYYNSNGNITEVSLKLAANPFSRTGYTFSGWTDGAPSATITKTPAVSATATYTEKALWSINSYTVTYVSAYGTAPAAVTKEYNTTYALPAAMTYGPTTANGYKITYNANGHGTAPSADTMTDTTTYSFGGWNTKSDGSGTNYAAKANYTVPANNVTLYAKWTTSTTKGSTTLATMSTQSSGSGTSAKQWLFKGWSTSSSGTTPLSSPYTPTGNVTLYAIWEDDLVTISYNSNGGTGTITSISKYRNATGFTVSNGSGFTKSGCKFIGWNTNAKGTGTKYIPSSTNVALPSSGNLVLYAVWYENFVWTDNDTNEIKAGQPTSNATATKWNTLETNIKTYYDSSYTSSTVTSGGVMVASKFKTAADKIGSSMTASHTTAGTTIIAVDFNNIKDKINEVAKYLGAT